MEQNEKLQTPFVQDWLELERAFSSSSGDSEIIGFQNVKNTILSSDDEEVAELAWQKGQVQTKKVSKPPRQQKAKLSIPQQKKEEMVHTDPDSLYRKLYNKSLSFFIWIIETEPGPFIVKLHIQALSIKEMNMNQVRASLEALINGDDYKINISFYAAKKQFKVFVTIQNSKTAVQFFEKVFTMKTIQIFTADGAQERDMRAYLVKSEAEYQQLAMKKYAFDLQKNSESQKTNDSSRGRGRGSGSNRGKRGGFSCNEEFSHSSGTQLGGSAGSEVYQGKSEQIEQPSLQKSTSVPNLLENLNKQRKRKNRRQKKEKSINKDEECKESQSTLTEADILEQVMFGQKQLERGDSIAGLMVKKINRK